VRHYHKISFFLFLIVVSSFYLIYSGHVTAQTQNIKVFFNPFENTLPPNKLFTLMLDSGTEKIAYVKLDIYFNKNQVNLAQEIDTAYSFENKIRATSMTEANSSGRATIELGLSSDQYTHPPQGTFALAGLVFTNVVKNAKVRTSINAGIDGQLITTDARTLTYQSYGSFINIDPEVCGFQGDATADCITDGVDYMIWLMNYDRNTNDGAVTGDFNLSGKVDWLDYVVFLAGFGR